MGSFFFSVYIFEHALINKIKNSRYIFCYVSVICPVDINCLNFVLFLQHFYSLRQICQWQMICRCCQIKKRCYWFRLQFYFSLYFCCCLDNQIFLFSFCLFVVVVVVVVDLVLQFFWVLVFLLDLALFHYRFLLHKLPFYIF